MQTGNAGSPEDQALVAVSALADGPPIDPTWRVTVNFHPDRLVDKQPLLSVLRTDGVLRSQFETRTSNGGLTAFEGGDRWGWESRIFAGAYDRATPDRRPKYGALNYRRMAVGASPRFGSAHFRLGAHLLARTTLCYPDSCFEPRSFGVASRMGLVPLAESDERDLLDRYIEAHVHATIDIARDVEALVLDPCYVGTPIEAQARALPVPVEWHPGFRVSIETLRRHPDYRGQHYIDLADDIAVDGVLTPRVIGEALLTGSFDGNDFKKVWHYLARFSSVLNEAR